MFLFFVVPFRAAGLDSSDEVDFPLHPESLDVRGARASLSWLARYPWGKWNRPCLNLVLLILVVFPFGYSTLVNMCISWFLKQIQVKEMLDMESKRFCWAWERWSEMGGKGPSWTISQELLHFLIFARSVAHAETARNSKIKLAEPCLLPAQTPIYTCNTQADNSLQTVKLSGSLPRQLLGSWCCRRLCRELGHALVLWGGENAPGPHKCLTLNVKKTQIMLNNHSVALAQIDPLPSDERTSPHQMNQQGANSGSVVLVCLSIWPDFVSVSIVSIGSRPSTAGILFAIVSPCSISSTTKSLTSCDQVFPFIQFVFLQDPLGSTYQLERVMCSTWVGSKHLGNGGVKTIIPLSVNAWIRLIRIIRMTSSILQKKGISPEKYIKIRHVKWTFSGPASTDAMLDNGQYEQELSLSHSCRCVTHLCVTGLAVAANQIIDPSTSWRNAPARCWGPRKLSQTLHGTVIFTYVGVVDLGIPWVNVDKQI